MRHTFIDEIYNKIQMLIFKDQLFVGKNGIAL